MLSHPAGGCSKQGQCCETVMRMIGHGCHESEQHACPPNPLETNMCVAKGGPGEWYERKEGATAFGVEWMQCIYRILCGANCQR